MVLLPDAIFKVPGQPQAKLNPGRAVVRAQKKGKVIQIKDFTSLEAVRLNSARWGIQNLSFGAAFIAHQTYPRVSMTQIYSASSGT